MLCGLDSSLPYLAAGPFGNSLIYPWWKMVLQAVPSCGFMRGRQHPSPGPGAPGQGLCSPAHPHQTAQPGSLSLGLSRDRGQVGWLDLSNDLPLGRTVISLSFLLCFVDAEFKSKEINNALSQANMTMDEVRRCYKKVLYSVDMIAIEMKTTNRFDVDDRFILEAFRSIPNNNPDNKR